MMARLHDDGGPAFPQLEVIACERDGHGDLIEPFTAAAGGMSLRDVFAAAAMQGLIRGTGDLEWAAKRSYNAADALLKARKAGA